MSKTGKRTPTLEPGPGFRASLRELPRNLNGFNIPTGIFPAAAFTLAFSAAAVPLLQQAGWSSHAIVAFLTASWAMGGLIGVVLSLYYKIPISGAWSFAAFVLAVSTLDSVSIAEAFGGFLLAALVVCLMGITGTFRWIESKLPLPILLAMVAGILMEFPVAMVSTFQGSTSAAIIVAAGILGYLVFDRLGGFFRLLPGLLGVFLFSCVAAGVLGELDFSGFDPGFGAVEFHTPSLSVASVFSIALPMIVIVLGEDNMQATGILTAAGHKPPLNAMTLVTGIGWFFGSLMGASNANIAGPTTAVVSSPDAGPEEGRYVAGALSGVTYIALAVAMGTVVSFIGALPGALTTVLLGMVLLRPIIEAIQKAWGAGKFAVGAFFAFVIAVSGVSFFGVGAAFWSLVGGALASLLFEFEDYKRLIRNQELAAAEPAASEVSS